MGYRGTFQTYCILNDGRFTDDLPSGYTEFKEKYSNRYDFEPECFAFRSKGEIKRGYDDMEDDLRKILSPNFKVFALMIYEDGAISKLIFTHEDVADNELCGPDY